MTIVCKLFASARDLAGADELKIELPESSPTGAVLNELVARNPGFKEWIPFLRLAVNESYVTNEHALKAGDVVAVLPPVSGG
jgi:molybdopterin synthase sulfur carrier subunit